MYSRSWLVKTRRIILGILKPSISKPEPAILCGGLLKPSRYFSCWRHHHAIILILISSVQILKRKQNGFEPVRNVNDQEIPKLLTEKDSENTKRSTKVCTTLFEEYLKQKQRNYLVIKYLPTGVGSWFLSSFWIYNKTIIEFGFRMISRIMKASVCVIHLSLRSITQTSVLIIRDIVLDLIQ